MEEKTFFKKYPIITNLLIMLGISLVIIMLAMLSIRLFSRHGKAYSLEQIVGCSVDSLQAGNALDLEFVVLDSTYREGQRGGIILTQDPKAGTQVKKGRKVYVTITAYSPDDAVMPDILGGVTLRTAISQLEGVGLRVGRLRFVDNPFRNTVIEASCAGQQVTAGTKLVNGAKVDLVVGIGDDPSKAYSVVPFVIGKRANRARREIQSASFNIGVEHFDGVSDKASAVVYQQTPSYDGVSRYPFGVSVELWYCDADEQKINKLVSDYRIDSSAIVNPNSQDAIEDYMEDEGLNW